MRRLQLTKECKALKVESEQIKYAAAIGGSGTQNLHGFNDLAGLKDGQYIGVVSVTDPRDNRYIWTRDIYLYETGGMMITCHGCSKWSIRFEDRKNGYDKKQEIASAKWFLESGVISIKEAEKMGYKA